VTSSFELFAERAEPAYRIAQARRATLIEYAETWD